MRAAAVPDRVDQWRRENPAKAAMPVVKFYTRSDGSRVIWVAHNGEYTLYADCRKCGKPLPPQVRKEDPERRRRGHNVQRRWRHLHPECRQSADEEHFQAMRTQKARRKWEAGGWWETPCSCTAGHCEHKRELQRQRELEAVVRG